MHFINQEVQPFYSFPCWLFDILLPPLWFFSKLIILYTIHCYNFYRIGTVLTFGKANQQKRLNWEYLRISTRENNIEKTFQDVENLYSDLEKGIRRKGKTPKPRQKLHYSQHRWRPSSHPLCQSYLIKADVSLLALCQHTLPYPSLSPITVFGQPAQ